MHLSNVLKITAASALLISAMPAFSQTLPNSKTVSGSSAQAAAAVVPGQPVQVKNAWVRAMVAGQQSTGAFMTVTARTSAGKSVQFKPGGYHVMLMDFKQPLTKGSTVPLTLFFKDEKGVESRMELLLPVAATAPGAAPASGKAAGSDHSVHFD